MTLPRADEAPATSVELRYMAIHAMRNEHDFLYSALFTMLEDRHLDFLNDALGLAEGVKKSA